MLVIGVHSQPVFPIAFTDEGDDGPAEVDGSHAVIDHHLGRIDVFQCLESLFGCEGFDECCDLCLRVIETFLDGIELLGLYERFIALNVDDDVVCSAYSLVSLLATVSTAFEVCACHHHLSSELFYSLKDAFVVCGHIDFVHALAHLFIHSLYHRLASQESKWFGRKACRCISCWNNTNESHLKLFVDYYMQNYVKKRKHQSNFATN